MKKSIILVVLVTLNFFGLKAQIAWPQNGSNIYYNGGNVGIGTTAPSYPLDIFKQIDGLSLINVQNASEVSGCGSGIRFFTRQYGGGGSWWSNIVLKGDRKLHFNMEQKEDAMLIDQAGNVGIGTTTPLTKLHIEGSSANWNETIPGSVPGTIHLSTGTTNDHYGNAITWGASDADGAQAGIYTRSDGTYGTKMYFATTDSYVTGSKTRMFIGANGNVGIGTTAPTSVFEVNKDINDIWTTSIKNGGGSSKGLSIEVGYGGDNTSTIMQLGDANGNTRAIFKSNGNVGIGTTVPSYPLDIFKQIDGLSLINVQNTSVVSGCGSGIRFFTRQYGGGGSWWSNIVLKGDRKLHFNMEQKEDAMLIDQAGNVGIGTTNPQYKLAVEGTIAAREVKVTAESWADFVFHPTYKLRTLGEVEQFIKANSHLPEIPTAAEVKENGVSLGEMNAKLLQKVEELTLYLIEMKKDNEDLKNRVSELEKKQL